MQSLNLTLEDVKAVTGAEPYAPSFSSPADQITIRGIKPLEEADTGELSFFAPTSQKTISELSLQVAKTKASGLLVKTPIPSLKIPQLLSPEPLMSIIQVAERWFSHPAPEPGISPKADIHPSAEIGSGVHVGPFSAIGANVKIGEGSIIYPNAVIYPGVKLGPLCVIHAGAILRENISLGRNCIVYNGAVVGSEGFGYKRGSDGTQHRIPHIGTVELGDYVDIGANGAVDRGMLGNTIIGKNTKIDNLVQVGHNNKIGESTLICSQVGISGSCNIGDDCIFGGQVGIADHLTIPSGTKATGQTGITRSPEVASELSGTPAMKASKWRRILASQKKLPEMIKALKKRDIEI